jgi:hypothetical protein
MKLTIALLFILFSRSTFAQTDSVRNEYEQGISKNGFVEGVWSYYDEPGKLALKIDYDKAKILFLEPDTNEYVIKIDDEWKKSKLDIHPRYIGSMREFRKIPKFLRYPVQARINETAGNFYISFEIDTLGKAGNYQAYNDIGDKCGEEVIKTLSAMPNYWLTAKKDGKTYAAKYIIPVTFKMTVDNREISPKKVRRPQELPLAKKLTDITIHAYAITRTSTSH